MSLRFAPLNRDHDSNGTISDLCNCARRRVPESEQTAFVMITDLLWLNRQLKYNKENKTIRLIIIENMYNIYKD